MYRNDPSELPPFANEMAIWPRGLFGTTRSKHAVDLRRNGRRSSGEKVKSKIRTMIHAVAAGRRHDIEKC